MLTMSRVLMKFVRHCLYPVLAWATIFGAEPAPAQDFTRLQVAIDNTPRGGMLTVPAGVYRGNLVIGKKLRMVGIGHPVIQGDGTGSCLTITADSCVIEGLVIERSGTMLVNEDAGILVKSNRNRIEGNKLRDILFGIYLLQADHNTVEGNTIVGRRYLELGERGSGIHLWNSLHNTLRGNVITDARDGFYIQNANFTLIEGNDVSNLRYGLHYMYADSNVFLNNRFHDNVAGAAVMYSQGIAIRHNLFTHNRGFASYGILFQECHGMVVDSNAFADNVIGMFFEASTNNLFRHNIVAQNDVALQMFQNSIDNTFTENNFIDNLSPLSIVGKRTGSKWSDGKRGNYWSSYDGYDIDNDGIGDVPMKIQNVFSYLEGSFPSLRVYLYSPTSQAIAAAAKAFPILQINEELDPYPLMSVVDLGRMPAVQYERGMTDRLHPQTRGAGWLWTSGLLLGFFGVAYLRLLKRGVS